MRLLVWFTCAAFVAGCSSTGSPGPINPPGDGSPETQVRANAHSYKVLYSFKFTPDGAWPVASLLVVNGMLYGTTSMGGSGPSNFCGSEGCGTIFAATTAGGSGSETVLHSFAGGTDGSMPTAGLTNDGGTLYGTTELDGKSFGTVYQYVPGGAESVLYAFKGSTDGSGPQSGLLAKGPVLYGTTYAGGSHSYGTIFRVTTAGKESIAYNFAGPPASDGSYPTTSVVEASGTLYGTTSDGGAAAGGTAYGFSTTMKSETNLYSFPSAGGSAMPSALVNVHGTFYGTTGGGGNGGSQCPSSGCGTVFSITPSGATFTFKNIYNFKGGTDGVAPAAGLVLMNGKLFGTTSEGGGSTHCPPYGCGTVFSITTSGTETVLHKFGNGYDGQDPQAGLTPLSGTLYGTTRSGGSNGFGTIFALTP